MNEIRYYGKDGKTLTVRSDRNDAGGFNQFVANAHRKVLALKGMDWIRDYEVINRNAA